MPVGAAIILAKEAAKKTIKETAKQIAKESKKDALKGKLKQAVKAEVKEEVKDKVVEEIDDKVMDVGAARKASAIAKGDGLKGKLSQAVKSETRERVMDDVNENIIDTGAVQKGKSALDATKTADVPSENNNTSDSNDSKNTESISETRDNDDRASDSDASEKSLRDRLSEAVKEDGQQREDTTKSENSDNTQEKNSDAIADELSKRLEYDEDGTRELTEGEKDNLKEKLGWSDEKINDNCRIDEDGVIHYKTDCQDKEGTTSDCGVPYKRKVFEYNGIKIEGVFPEFDSKFDTKLNEEFYQSSSCKQFSECNKSLKEAIENNPDMAKTFTKEQLSDIKNGNTPGGYTWHHAEEPGKMQLVKTTDHDRRIGGAAHTGGNSIWGNKSVENTDNSQKGESF